MNNNYIIVGLSACATYNIANIYRIIDTAGRYHIYIYIYIA